MWSSEEQRLVPTSTVSWHKGYGNHGPPGMDSTTIDKCVCCGEEQAMESSSFSLFKSNFMCLFTARTDWRDRM